MCIQYGAYVKDVFRVLERRFKHGDHVGVAEDDPEHGEHPVKKIYR